MRLLHLLQQGVQVSEEFLCISFSGMEASPQSPYTLTKSFLLHFSERKLASIEKSRKEYFFKIVLPEE